MDFAADAVFDAIAPQPRPANARPAPANESEPSFDDHLEAASAEEAPPVETSGESEKPDTTEKSSTAEAEALPQPLAPQPAPQPSAQFIVQLVAPEAPAASPVTDAAPNSDVAASEAANIQAPPPSAPQAAPVDAAQPDTSAPAADATKTQHAQQKSESDTPKVDVAPVADAPEAAPPTPTQNNAPTPAPSPVATAPVSAEAAEAIAAIAPQTAPTQPVTRETAPRSAKTDARGESKPEAAPETNAAAAQPPAARTAAKSAPTPQGNKDLNIATAAAAPIADAPEPPAPAPAPQPTAISTPAATQTQHATLENNVARSAPAAAQVAREIVRQFDGENTRFEMRLDPPELGRVEVRLEVSRDHRVTAVIAADSPQALAELARHARDLEQMLQSSGLQLSDSGLSFDLRQGGEGNSDTEEASANARGLAAGDDATQQQATTARPLGYERWRGVRVDVMV
jgi:flagellar hook-length control protein FliK